MSMIYNFLRAFYNVLLLNILKGSVAHKLKGSSQNSVRDVTSQ